MFNSEISDWSRISHIAALWSIVAWLPTSPPRLGSDLPSYETDAEMLK